MTQVLFISRYYPPEKAAAAVCVSEFAKRLVKLGYHVTVLTTVPNYPNGIVPPEYQGRILQEEMLDGVRVIRTWSYVSANRGFLRRIVSQLSFGCIAPLLGGKAVGRPDLIIVESPPLFNVIVARILARFKRCPFIFWVADLWPESAVQLGALHNRTFIWFSERLEWSTYQRASLVWAVTEKMRDTLIQRGLTPQHILLITNGVDTTKFHPLGQSEARAALGWDSRFTVLYAGTHGLSHGLTMILDAAEQLHNHHDIRFVLAGDGSEKAHLIAQAENRKLNNVTFLASLPHNHIPQLLAAADVCLAHARKVELFEGMLPIKMYEAMACARPLLLGLNGEARQLAEQEAGAALYIEPENADALASSVLYLKEHPEVAEELGEHGRSYIQTHFDYELLTAKLATQIAKLLGPDKDVVTSEVSARDFMPSDSVTAGVASEKR